MKNIGNLDKYKNNILHPTCSYSTFHRNFIFMLTSISFTPIYYK